MLIRTDKERGFTLIELLVVISIIGFLSSVIYSTLGSARAKARNAYTLSMVGQYMKAQEVSVGDTGGYLYSSTQPTWMCLGAVPNNGSKCWEGSYSENAELNTAIDKYIKNHPNPNPTTVMWADTPYKGSLYYCSTGSVSTGCTDFYLYYWLENTSTCPIGPLEAVYLNGSTALCLIHKKI